MVPAGSRALILAGGGMRVAWQAGVVRALAEAGVDFDHIDGTSGGVMNAAMLLSGVDPVEMGERWSSLDAKAFASPLPLTRYLRGPSSLVAFGDADGVRGEVFPHLGIDFGRIRASVRPSGSFNVCDFTEKACVAVPHTELDEDLLVAAMSLPVVMPAVERDGRAYTDAVWIKDANLVEAVRRGMRELWLVWCIGNTPTWHAGPFEQYVHMIEMSANGGLAAELEILRLMDLDVELHVIKPEYPLPLDPEYFGGRVDGATLVAMGYRDARRYLDARPPGGVPLQPSVTRMTEPPLGARFVERARGEGASLEVCVEVRDLDAFASDPAAGTDLVGWLELDGVRRPLANGRFAVDGDEVRYVADGLLGTKILHDDPGLDLWSDLTTIRLQAPDGTRRTLRSTRRDVRRMVRSIQPTGAHDTADRARLVAALGRVLLRSAWESRRS